MSRIKRWLEELSVEMGLEGEINEEVVQEGQRRFESSRYYSAITRSWHHTQDQEEVTDAEEEGEYEDWTPGAEGEYPYER